MDPVNEREVEHGLVEKARRVLPGGTFGNLPSEVVIREGRGGRVWEEGGGEYVDFLWSGVCLGKATGFRVN